MTRPEKTPSTLTKRQIIQNTMWMVLENAPSMLTVLFASYVLLRSQIGTVSPTEYSVWILSVLGLLATSELVERFRHLRRVESIAKQTLDAVSRSEEHLGAEDFLKRRREYRPFDQFAAEAQEISMVGYSLLTLISANMDFLYEKVRNGCLVRVIVVNPECQAAEMANIYLVLLTTDVREHVENVLGILHDIRKRVGNNNKKLLKVHTLDYLPRYSLVVLDGRKPSGKVAVELYPHKVSGPDRPHFELEPIKDGQWYDFFHDQFEELWADSKPARGFEDE